MEAENKAEKSTRFRRRKNKYRLLLQRVLLIAKLLLPVKVSDLARFDLNEKSAANLLSVLTEVEVPYLTQCFLVPDLKAINIKCCNCRN